MNSIHSPIKARAEPPAKRADQGSSKPARKSAGSPGAKGSPRDAISMLKAEHVAVTQLFAEFERTRSVPRKKEIVGEICTALTVHAQIEEEIFYPEVQSALKDRCLVPEATVEHAGVKDLIAQIEGVEPDGALYDAKVKVLSEYVKHHVKEEQEEMFPKARASSLDLVELGARMVARKEDLMAQTA
ncbi:MAG: hypothetical protein RL227_945 [Pseudomonadota bacterium]|jgi:hemerythrin superfamily protein